MKTVILPFCLATVLTVVGLPPAFSADLSAVGSPKAEPPAATPAAKPGPAWGAADVQPTPEHPVHFRWTLGHFPCAQPPLEFWDGTPTTRGMEYPDRHDPKVIRKKMIPDFADSKSKNIQWKARVPGWGLSHPIVVGPSTSLRAGNSSAGSRLRADATRARQGRDASSR